MYRCRHNEVDGGWDFFGRHLNTAPWQLHTIRNCSRSVITCDLMEQQTCPYQLTNEHIIKCQYIRFLLNDSQPICFLSNNREAGLLMRCGGNKINLLWIYTAATFPAQRLSHRDQAFCIWQSASSLAFRIRTCLTAIEEGLITSTASIAEGRIGALILTTNLFHPTCGLISSHKLCHFAVHYAFTHIEFSTRAWCKAQEDDIFSNPMDSTTKRNLGRMQLRFCWCPRDTPKNMSFAGEDASSLEVCRQREEFTPSRFLLKYTETKEESAYIQNAMAKQDADFPRRERISEDAVC